MSQLLQMFSMLRSVRLMRTGLAFLLFVAAAQPGALHAQTFSVLYNFQGIDAGFYPTGGVSIDRAGNLYGTTEYGGPGTTCFLGCGIAFKLTPHGSSWQFAPIYSFTGGNDGGNPVARLVVGPDGSLFGTTNEGGGTGCFGSGCGTVFNLRPPARFPNHVIIPWSETVLYRFQGGNDGGGPEAADLVFDPAGNLYGTTLFGGGSSCFEDCGIVYQLTHSGGTWTENILHVFGSTGDGDQPYAGVILDSSGNIYGTTAVGGAHRQGTVYELVHSGSGWTEQILYSIAGGTDGQFPYTGLVTDPAGNLYSTTCCGGGSGGGTVFGLTAGTWNFNLLFTLGANGTGQGSEGTMVRDSFGNLYGTTSSGGAYNFGAVFKLSYINGTWTYTSIHDFCAGGYPPCADGYTPTGSLALDSTGNLYGTTSNGGANGGGVVYKITP
jgi:uncharacterized repeat protein (TIGR03803 family)